jgi:hypothetical protein
MNILCRLGLHKFGLMRSYRLCPSVVYTVRCSRCGKQDS